MKIRNSVLLTDLAVFLLLLAALLIAVIRMNLSSPAPPAPRETIHVQSSAPTVELVPRTQPPVWTDEDRVVQARLADRLRGSMPVQRIVYDQAKVMEGKVVEEHADYIVFKQTFGESGEVSVKLPRERVVIIEQLNRTTPEITLRDVGFFREFPGKEFYKKPPYTLLTDESFFAVEKIVKQQQELYERFVEKMRPLVAASARRDDIQIVIFSDPAEYAAYVKKYAPELEGSGGFYSVAKDRLVVLHQRQTEWMDNVRREIAKIEKEQQGKMKTANDFRRLAQWKQDATARLMAQAVEQTQTTLRHEGAHQLAYTLGIQTPLQSGHGWVSEGIATFFETERPGQISDSRLSELRKSKAGNQLVPLGQLLAMPRCKSPLDYAESCLLTGLLMKPEYRAGFFAYLDRLRRHPEPSLGDPLEELCQSLTCSPHELEQRWQDFIGK